jgi:hypothetical protein
MLFVVTTVGEVYGVDFALARRHAENGSDWSVEGARWRNEWPRERGQIARPRLRQ